MRQMAIKALVAGHLPVFVPAKQYDGKRPTCSIVPLPIFIPTVLAISFD